MANKKAKNTGNNGATVNVFRVTEKQLANSPSLLKSPIINPATIGNIPSPNPDKGVVNGLLRKLSERSKGERRQLNAIKHSVETALNGLVEKSDRSEITYLFDDAADVKTMLVETFKSVGIRLTPGKNLIFNAQVDLGKEYILVKDALLGTTSTSKKPHVGFKINAFINERNGKVAVYYSSYKKS